MNYSMKHALVFNESLNRTSALIGNCSRDRVAILMSNWNCIKMVTERDLEGVDLVFASFSQYCNEKTKEISSSNYQFN